MITPEIYELLSKIIEKQNELKRLVDALDAQEAAGGSGAVDSVNGYTGTVVLDPDDLDDSATTNKFATATNVAGFIDGASVSATMSTTDKIAAVIGGTLRYFTYQTIRDAITSYYNGVVATLTNKSIDASTNTLTNVDTSALANNAVTNAKAADMAADTIKGRANGAGTGDPTDLTATQALTILSSVISAAFWTFTNKIAIAATATTGYALSATRDLPSGSTDSPVVQIIQDNASDDQSALNVRQDGPGPIAVFDGVGVAYTDINGLAQFIDDTDREIVIGGLGMFRRDTNADNGDLRFNFLGYNGGVTRYRDYKIYDGKSNLILTVDGSESAVQIGPTAPAATLHVDQSSATAAKPVLLLDQADLSEEMIEFTGAVGTGNTIEAKGAKSLTTTHFIRVSITGVGYVYIPVGTIA